MANKRLIALVTALVLASGGQGAQAAFSFSSLQLIEQYIINEQWTLLRAYLIANPGLLQGDNVLAVELQNFVATYGNGIISSIAVPPTKPNLLLVAAMKDSY